MKPQRKDTGGRKSEQHPNLPQLKPSSVQITVECALQESDSTAINDHARTDHQSSKKSSFASNPSSTWFLWLTFCICFLFFKFLIVFCTFGCHPLLLLACFLGFMYSSFRCSLLWMWQTENQCLQVWTLVQPPWLQCAVDSARHPDSWDNMYSIVLSFCFFRLITFKSSVSCDLWGGERREVLAVVHASRRQYLWLCLQRDL